MNKTVYCPECREESRVIEYVKDGVNDPKWICTCDRCDNLFYLFDRDNTPDGDLHEIVTATHPPLVENRPVTTERPETWKTVATGPFKMDDVRVGDVYVARVGNNMTRVRVDRSYRQGGHRSPVTGKVYSREKTVLECTNLTTNRVVVVKAASKFRSKVVVVKES